MRSQIERYGTKREEPRSFTAGHHSSATKSGRFERDCWNGERKGSIEKEALGAKRAFTFLVRAVSAELPLFSENMCREAGLVMEYLYSTFKLETLQNLHLGLSELLENCLIQHLSSHDDYSHPDKPSGRQKRLSLLNMSLLRACNDILVHIEEQCALLGLHLNFAKREKNSTA